MVQRQDYQGAMILNDVSSSSMVYSSVTNQFTSRFAGGYRLYSNTGLTTGVTLAAGGTSWSSISDSRAKEDITDLQYGLAEVLQLSPALISVHRK